MTVAQKIWITVLSMWIAVQAVQITYLVGTRRTLAFNSAFWECLEKLGNILAVIGLGLGTLVLVRAL